MSQICFLQCKLFTNEVLLKCVTYIQSLKQYQQISLKINFRPKQLIRKLQALEFGLNGSQIFFSIDNVILQLKQVEMGKNKKNNLNILELQLSEISDCDCICEPSLIILKIESELFMFKAEYRFTQVYVEGVWILFYTFLDLFQNQATFYFYQSESQEQKEILIESIQNISGTLIHQVGGCLDISLEYNQDLNQFQGKISEIFQSDVIFIKDNLKNCVPKDCIEYQTMNLIETKAFSGDEYEEFETEILEKQIYQLNGWFKFNYSDSISTIQIFQIKNKNLKKSEINFAYDLQETLRFCSDSEMCSQNCKFEQLYNSFYEFFQNWHYFQLDVGSPKNNAVLQIFLQNTQIKIELTDACLYTGEKNVILIGGNSYSAEFQIGIIANLQYRAFCEIQEYSFIPKCHFSCQSCSGPFFDNCLTCYGNNILYNNKCICKTQNQGNQEPKRCIKISEAFLIIQEKEEKINQDIINHEYFDLEGNIICSYGTFLYKNQCVKCPYYNLEKQDIQIFCLNCYLNPYEFYLEPKCSIDAISYNNQKDNTYELIERSKDQIDYYGIYEIEKDQHQLKLLFGQENQFGDELCKKGYYQQSDQCLPCSFACFQCTNELKCEQCQVGYYLNQQFYCSKCENCEECSLQDGQINCSKCPDKFYLNKEKKCIRCGSFCANCNSNGFCNYCVDQQKYFISLLNGKDCQICDIKNCEYCYQQPLSDGIQQVFFPYYNFLNINFNDIGDFVNRCAKCNQGYSLINIFKDDDQFVEEEFCDQDIYQETQKKYCAKRIYDFEESLSCTVSMLNIIDNCLEGIDDSCILCMSGYYSDYETNNYTLPLQVQLFSPFSKDYKDYQISILSADVLVKCSSCKDGFILVEDKCIKDCALGCLQCEVINYKAICIKCDQQLGIKKSLDENGQCQECSTNCAACLQNNISDYQSINKYFIQSQQNSIQTKFCFSKYDAKVEEVYFYLNHYVLKDCVEFERCKSIFSLTWNLYCDINEFESLPENNGNEFIQNYFVKDFFDLNAINLIETELFINYISDNLFTQIEINLNLIQGNAEDCKFSSVNFLKSNLFSQILLLKNLNLKIFSQSNSQLINLILQITGFTQVTFENLQIQYFKINFIGDYINQINFFNCNISKISSPDQQAFSLISDQPFHLNIQNFSIQNCTYQNQIIFQFLFDQDNESITNINIKNLTIYNSSFYYSTLIFINKIQGKQNVFLKITDVTILNSNFSFSNVIFSQGGRNILVGIMEFENQNFSNMLLVKSKIFMLQNVQKATFEQISMDNSHFQESSYFLLSNNFQCKNFAVTNINLNRSYLLSNQVDLFYQINENSIVQYQFLQFKLEKINYDNSQSILQITKYQSFENLLNITVFQLIDAQYQLLDLNNFVSQDLALIHIDCQICFLDQILIERANGVPEISIQNSNKITITNTIFTQSKRYFSQSATIYDCFNNIQQFYYLYIGFYEEIIIDNLIITDATANNYPFIIIQGTDIMNKQVIEKIEINNSVFQNNVMTISSSNSASTIIQVYSEQQQSMLQITNSQFSSNFLNAYISDLTVLCSSTILITIKTGNIVINNSQFIQNVITNSTNSIIYVKASNVTIMNSNFYQNNFQNFTNLIKLITLEENIQVISIRELQKTFQIYSNGGNGQILANYLKFSNLSVNESYSMQGGAFYINVFGDSYILLENNNFFKTSSSLLSASSSLGGCFYIDAQASKLTLFIKNTTFESSFSRQKGGVFYIIPSNTLNQFYFSEIKIINCFSTESSFLDFSFRNQKLATATFDFQRIFINQTKQGFNYYLSLLDQLSTQESTSLVNSNPIFYISAGNLSFQILQIASEVGIFLIQIDEGQNINLYDFTIIQGGIFFSSFIKINLKSGNYSNNLGYKSTVEISKFQIKNVLEKSLQDIVNSPCQSENNYNQINFYCFSQNSNSFTKKIKLIDNQQETQDNQLICNQEVLLNTENQNYNLIEIINVEKIHFIQLEQIKFQSVSCKYCQYGLINIRQIEVSNQTNIELNELSFKNCTCNLTSCLTIIYEENESIFKTNLLNQNRIMQLQDYNHITEKFDLQVILRNSLFISNVAKYGGGISIIGIDILILNSNFINNTADIGGAIYYEQNNTQLLLLQTNIINNTAKIAGGLYLYDSSLQETQKLEVFLNNNNSTISESGVLEKPRSLGISVDADKTILSKKFVLNTIEQIVEQILVQSYDGLGHQQNIQSLIYPSGQAIGSYSYFDFDTFQNINHNLSLRILALNKFDEKETNLEGSVCKLEYKIINITNEEEMNYFTASISMSKVNFDTSAKDFNLDNLIIQFNPYYSQEIVLRLSISCDCIQIPIEEILPPFSISKIMDNYQLQVDIRTFPCQLGEYFNSISGICIQCDPNQNQYQVILNATSCQFKDDQKIKSVKSQVIELKPNYWRAYFYSTEIEECLHLYENCLGGWYPGDASCTQGHIGALCEQCDIYNVRGNGQFATKSLYKCGSCDQIIGNVFSIILIYIWTVITVLISVSSTIETIKQFIAGKYLIAFGVRYLNKKSSTAVLIKIFTNYSQIVQTILTFQLKISETLFSIFTHVSNPIEQMTYSLDCFLTTISSTPIIYLRIIWMLFMSTSYILTFLILLVGAIILKKIKFNISMVTTVFIYIFIYSQPNMIQYLISLVSFRVISEVAWISGNVSYRYDTSEHKIWLLSFCLPLLLIFSLIIPGFMYYKLRSQKQYLDSNKMREKWGYLYNEYAQKAYYWEFIKILQKECIIIVLSYYEDYITIKAPLTFLFIFAYSHLTTSVSPYQTGELNKLDIQSTTICGISIILGGAIYSSQNFDLNELVYSFYSVIITLNAYFLFKVIFKIIYAYLNLFHTYIDKIKEIISLKYQKQLERYPQITLILESQKIKEMRIKANFEKIKKYLFQEARKNLRLRKSTKIDSEYYALMVMNTQILTLQDAKESRPNLKQETNFGK